MWYRRAVEVDVYNVHVRERLVIVLCSPRVNVDLCVRVCAF